MSTRKFSSLNKINIFNKPDESERVRLLAGALLLVAYVAALAILLPRHEAWADEAQAWQLTRSVGLGELFARWLHFEMTPGLWSLLLRAEAAAGLGYVGMHYVTAAIAAGATAVLLWRSPFPLYLRALLPFGFFLAFQYALVARSYALTPLLLFMLAAMWQRRWERPIVTAMLLSLLANVSAQVLFIVLGLTIVLGLESLRNASRSRRWQRNIAMIILFASIAFAFWCCRPPADAPWVMAAHTWATAGHTTATGAARPEWQRWHGLAAAALHGRAFELKVALNGGLVRPLPLALPVWASLLLYLWWRRELRYVWPVVTLAFFGTFTRFSPYHQGLVWLVVIFLLWVTWPATNSKEHDSSKNWWHCALIASVTFCAVVQTFWTANAARREWRDPYSPSVAAVPVLKAYLAQGRTVDLAMPGALTSGATPPAFFAVAMQPYFDHQPFANVSARFWSWTGDASAHERYLRDTEQHGVVVFLVDYLDRSKTDEARLVTLGYREAHRFCATNIYPRRYPVEEVCYLFYEPTSTAE